MIHHILAAALLVTQAAPTTPDCITHEEAGDIAVALLPYLVDAAVQRCRPHLAAGAFLVTGAGEWSARLRRDAAPRRASALRGISKFGGATPPAGAGGDTAFDFMAQMLTGSLSNNIKPENCVQIDAIAQSLEPLPADNIARLVGAGLSLAMTANDDDDDDENDDNGRDSDDEGDGEENGDDGPPFCRA